MKQFGFKTDQYRTNRGGASRLLEVRCQQCQTIICQYQKDGPVGVLRRMYFDRIIEPTTSMVKQQLVCPNSHVLGVNITYEKEARSAVRLFVDAVRYKTIKRE